MEINPTVSQHRPALTRVLRHDLLVCWYLLFRDVEEAWRVLQEIRNDSLAIGVHVYYKGFAGEAAEEMLNLDAHIDCPVT